MSAYFELGLGVYLLVFLLICLVGVVAGVARVIEWIRGQRRQ